MLDTRQLVHGDPFSFSALDLPNGSDWIPHQWLGECLMALVYRWRSFDGLLVVTTTLLAGLYAWIAQRLLRAGLHWILAVTVVGLGIAAGSSHFHVRPHLASLVGFAMTCAYWNDVENNRISLLKMVWLAPIYALWANLHGGLLGGVATMLLIWLGWILFARLRLPAPQLTARDYGLLGLLILGCAATAFVNPYGWRLPATWIEIMRLPNLGEIIQEHARLDPTSPEGIMVIILGAAYLSVLLGARASTWRVTWLIPMVWLCLSFDRVRHAPLFGIAAALAIGDVFPATRWATLLKRNHSDLFIPPAQTRDSNRQRKAWLVAGVLVVVVFVGLHIGGTEDGQPRWAVLDQRKWPVELQPELLRYPSGTRILNELNLGGFLILFAPRTRIFIDDRCELYGEKRLRDYDLSARGNAEQLLRWAEQYECTLALALCGSPFDHRLRNELSTWQLVAECNAASLFVRRDRHADAASRVQTVAEADYRLQNLRLTRPTE